MDLVQVRFMKVTPCVFKAAKASSKAWLARQSRDPYVKQRAQHPSLFRSRAAFKLLELDEKFKILNGKNVNVVIDLGAAPGGWSQVVASKFGVQNGVGNVTSSGTSLEPTVNRESPSRRSSDQNNPPDARVFREKKQIVAVDILPILPIYGVKTLRLDFLTPEAHETIASLLPPAQPYADVILSDIAVNMSGNSVRDSAMSAEVCNGVFDFASKHLRRGNPNNDTPGGTLVMKYFVNADSQTFYNGVLKPSFRSVFRSKPDASRSESSEFYFICKGFLPKIPP